MESLKQIIENYFKKNKQYIKSEDLKKKLKIKGEEQTESFFCALNELVEEGSLFFDEKKGYKIFTNDLGMAYGEIEINKNGTGFVHTKDGYTILIENCNLNGALNGDKVIVSSIDAKRKDYYNGEIYKVLKRKNGNVLFTVVGNGYKASLVPCNKYENISINVNKNELKNLVDGEIVLINVDSKNIDGVYLAEIIRVVGHKNDADIDIKMIYEKYNVPIEFSKDSLNELESIPTDVSEEDMMGRVDLRHLPIITIDCDSTKDRDDAIYIEKLSNGNYKLYTSISHISHYIKKGSKLYEEALKRRISHYPNNTCNPMFPPKISNGICSLNEDVDRLTRTFELEINKEGKIVDYKDYKSVIKSRKAMKYSEVNKVWQAKWFVDMINICNSLNCLKNLVRYWKKTE